MPPKDNFSEQSSLYAQNRPTYPTSFIEEILRDVNHFERAWDCGTGNGQVATLLASRFRQVDATDISQQQLDHAPLLPNVNYLRCPAEQSPFPTQCFDLITVAQAFHWFDHDAFFREVKRVMKPGGLLAFWGYSLPRISPSIDALVRDFYQDKIGAYWDSERKFVDEEYRFIDCPFPELPFNGQFYMEHSFTLKSLQGYLNSWSAVRHYIRDRQTNPVNSLMKSLKGVWPGSKPQITGFFPLFLRRALIT